MINLSTNTNNKLVIATCQKCKDPITYKTEIGELIDYKYCSPITKTTCRDCKEKNKIKKQNKN
jgi:hypothetical protein